MRDIKARIGRDKYLKPGSKSHIVLYHKATRIGHCCVSTTLYMRRSLSVQHVNMSGSRHVLSNSASAD